MLFHSQIFIILFLPIALAGFYALGHNRQWRLRWLVLASLVFYGYWDLRLLPILVLSILVNWVLARWLEKVNTGAVLASIIAVNLTLLGVFKYTDFILGTFAALTGGSHDPYNIALPLGISFFTFQQISMAVDLRRDDVQLPKLDVYALYVAFFPQLIAGPIIRQNEIVSQFDLDPHREERDENIARGATLFILGVAKKVLIADNLAKIADPTFAAVGHATLADGLVPVLSAWIGSLAFGLQIYFDFSGYSDMAIGLALMFGFTLPINFDRPFRAISMIDFWKRWHITMTRFFMSYVYSPIAVSMTRYSVTRRFKKHPDFALTILFPVTVTFALSGLWHGANWTFVMFGLVNAIGLIVNHYWSRFKLVRLPMALGWALTMMTVLVSFIYFRAGNIAEAHTLMASMIAGDWTLSPLPDWQSLALMVGAALLATLGPNARTFAHSLLIPHRALAVGGAISLVALLLMVGTGQNAEFIYFQF